MNGATLFAQRDQLAAALREVDARIDAERRAWSARNGYLIALRTEAFRKECER